MAGTASFKIGSNTVFAGACIGDTSLLSDESELCGLSSACFSGIHFFSIGGITGGAGVLATDFGPDEEAGGWADSALGGVGNSPFLMTRGERARGTFAFSVFGLAEGRVSPGALGSEVFASPTCETGETFCGGVLEAFGFDIGVGSAASPSASDFCTAFLIIRRFI
jgi:hypothetical protein